MQKLLNVKSTVVEDYYFYYDSDGVQHIRIQVRPYAQHENNCPFCHRSCPGYDQPTNTTRLWRAPDWGAVLVEVEGFTHRINCPEHGIVTAEVPWAYHGSHFTKDFDMNGRLASRLPSSKRHLRVHADRLGNRRKVRFQSPQCHRTRTDKKA